MRSFSYLRADDAASAVHASSRSSQFLAGGTTLLDLMKLDVMRPEIVVDINGLEDSHSDIALAPTGLKLGALATMAEAAEHPDIRRAEMHLVSAA